MKCEKCGIDEKKAKEGFCYGCDKCWDCLDDKCISVEEEEKMNTDIKAVTIIIIFVMGVLTGLISSLLN